MNISDQLRLLGCGVFWCLRVAQLRHVVDLFLGFEDPLQGFPQGMQRFASPPIVSKPSAFTTPKPASQHLTPLYFTFICLNKLVHLFFFLDLLIGIRWNIKVLSICMSLIAKDVDIFKMFLDFCISSFESSLKCTTFTQWNIIELWRKTKL